MQDRRARSLGGQGSVRETAVTHRDTLEGRGVHRPVDLVGDGLVVVVEVFQAHPRMATPSRRLVQGQCQGPDGIVGQRCLLEAARLLGVPLESLGQFLHKLLGCLQREGWAGLAWVLCVASDSGCGPCHRMGGLCVVRASTRTFQVWGNAMCVSWSRSCWTELGGAGPTASGCTATRSEL